jgi:hypothetical protein
LVSQILRFRILMAVPDPAQSNADRWAGGRNARIVRGERPCRYRGSGAKSEIVALVLVIFHRLMEDVIGRQRAQRFGDFR